MAIYRLDSSCRFPDPALAEPSGLLAMGGDLRPERLLAAYAAGIFPWYGPGEPILWWSPPERAVFLPGEGRVPRRAARSLRRIGYEVRMDTCFEAVLERCAEVPRPGQEGTWIVPEMRAAYLRLHREGHAHSFETFLDGRLVGGLYGVSLGGAFFGESMFSEGEQASRAAFLALRDRLWSAGFGLIDGQMPNENLDALGARIISREAYLGELRRALILSPRAVWS